MGLDILLQSQNSEEIKKCHPCDLCDKTLACKASFLNHKVLIHNIEKSFKCYKCGKGFANEIVLKRHEKQREKAPHICSTSTEPYKCDLCDKISVSERTLRDHMKTVHKKVGAFKCDTCDKTFNAQKFLYRHQNQRKNHRNICKTEKEIHRCDLCGKTFSMKGNLTSHKLKIHLKNRKTFKCGHCDKELDSKAALTRHLTEGKSPCNPMG